MSTMLSSAETELELELESELAHEGEAETAGELEQELELASEGLGEFLAQHEHEREGEHEAFFNHLGAMADRSGRSQALRRIALAAARSALRARQGPWPVIQGEVPMEGELGEAGMEGELAGPSPALGESLEWSPERQLEAVAMMEHAGHAATEAAHEQEAAEQFLPLIGLAAKFVVPKLAGLAAKKLGGMAAKKVGGRMVGRVGSQTIRRFAPRIIHRVAPQLTRGIANITRTLFRNPTTRPLVHALPRIARTTVARVVGQVAKGRNVTPAQAVNILARQTARTLGNPRLLSQSYRRSLAWDRRFHRNNRRILGRPAGSPAASVVPAAGIPVAPLAPSGHPAATWPGQAAPAPCGCRCNRGTSSVPAPAFVSAAAQAPQAPICPSCGRP